MERFEFSFTIVPFEEIKAHHAEGWRVIFWPDIHETLETGLLGVIKLSEEEINDLESAEAARAAWREIGDDSGCVWYRQVDEDGLPY